METKWVWPFELLDKLGEGGMGVVYRARYVGNNRQVAVKLLPDDINANPTLLARFERELDVLKQLRHPNIVHCFGGRCEGDQRYYAMELVSGGTLAEHLAEHGPLPWETAVDFAIQMCDALQHAHEHGVIHRDIKPANFLMTKTGQLKLSDFGIASVVAEGRLTAAGRTVGTMHYMAPEQIRGGALDHKADLYALGCVIFEMLSGHTPFAGTNAAEILQRHLKEPPPHVARLVLACPLELDSLVFELLSKDPDRRPVSAADVSSRLHAILLPSRRIGVAEPDLFGTLASLATKKSPVISPLKQIEPSDSETDIPQVTPQDRLRKSGPWIVAVIAVLVSCQFWFSWTRTAAQLRRAEQTWVTLLETADPTTRALAARSLGEFDALNPSTIRKLSAAANSNPVSVKLAAIKSLKQHATESRSVATELMRIQRVDEDAQVRAEAGLAVVAIQQTISPFSVHRYSFWTVASIIALGICATGWWVWRTLTPFA